MATTTRPNPVEVSLLPCTAVRFFFSLGKSLVPGSVTDFSLAASHSLCIYMMRQGESRGQGAPSEPHFLERSKQTEPPLPRFTKACQHRLTHALRVERNSSEVCFLAGEK